ncbi:hypothetical protein [Flagellimonas sp. S3867]|uniref:hypothetical protein n=1 Tax=Flagellimonas sp. S3867 TaxID=2768063 RepID=UPI001689FD3E|nr:hypothetical protein [Flagellimonas sp. S3867]
MKKAFFITLFILPFFLLGQTVEKPDLFKTVDNITLNDSVYTIKSKHSKLDFNLKLCTKDNCHVTQEFSRGILPQTLSRAIINFVANEIDTTLTDSLVKPEEKLYLNQLLTRINAAIEAEKSEAQKATEAIDNEKDQDAAIVVFKETARFSVNPPTKLEKRKYYKHVDTTHSHEGEELILKEAVIHFFNNKASSIYLQAKIKCETNSYESINLYNYKYSIPLRAFNYYDNASKLVRVKYILTGEANNGEEIEVHVNDVFDYINVGEKNQGNFGFSIANQKFRVANGENEPNTFKVTQRRFFDFFTGVVHSDLMGFNTDNSNSLINAQASLLMPLNLGNWSKLTAIKQFRLTINVALNNSFENENRFISFSDTDMVSHFDLLRKNNLNGTLSADILSYESKGWFSTYSLGYNLGFYRSGFRYSNTQAGTEDAVTNGQVLSISHGPYINFEFRPQDNFGADIMFSLEEFNINDQLDINERDFRDDIIEEAESNLFLVKHNLVNFSANFYWLTSPQKSNGGVYARVGAAYHTPTDAIFPQILVGYATNLTSFVNRFKPKTTSEPN